MRQQTVLTTNVIYPNDTVFVGDNVFISLSDSVYPTGAVIALTNMATLKTIELTYISELKNLTIDLTDSVRRLHQVGGCTMNCKVKVYSDKFYSGTFSFNFDTLDGKSLVHRQHGSTRTVYLYDPEDLTKVNLFFIGSGSFRTGNTSVPIIYNGRNSLNLSSWITGEGEYTGCYCYKCKGGGGGGGGIDETSRVEIVDAAVTINSALVSLTYHDVDSQPPKEDVKGGSVWADSKLNLADYCIRFIYQNHCDDFDFFKVKYYDTDGCLRYLGGKIINETTESKRKNYLGIRDSIFKDVSQKHIESSSIQVKVAYEDLRRDSYYSDILLAENVWFENYDGEWMPCSVADSKITVKSEDSADVEITYELMKQN